MDTHLITLRMQLYPAFVKSMDVQIESLRKINGTHASSGVAGVFGAALGGSSVKDSMVQVITRRYAELFNVFVRLSEQGDEEMVFSA